MVSAPLASVGSTASDPVELRWTLAARARRLVTVADAEDLVQASVVVREVPTKLTDRVLRLHKYSLQDELLVVKG